MPHEFKSGDRVRRTAVDTNMMYQAGMLGTVTEIKETRVLVVWDNPHPQAGTGATGYLPDDYAKLERVTAAVSPAPASEPQPALPHPAHMDLGQLAQMGMQNAQAYAQQRQQQGLGQQPVRCSAPWPCGKAHEDDGRCPHCDRNKYHAEAFHLRSELAVLKAEKARLADDLSVAQHNARRGELMEEEMQFYRRELSRVAPKLVVAHERNFNKKDPWR